MEASSAAAVMATAAPAGDQPGKIKERGKGLDIELKIPGMQPKVTTKDLVVFTRQFATMIDAGLPLVQCLDILGRQQDNKTFKKILVEVKESVESGSTFAEALKKHPKAFDELYVNLVAAGEVGGILDTILNRLAAYLEKALKLKKKVKSAMTYPATIIGIAVVVIAVILIFVIPAFEKMFADFGGALPTPTQIVINLSNFVQSYILAIIGVASSLFFAGFKRIYRHEEGA
jgi:type IV pilus assembly protein PilC